MEIQKVDLLDTPMEMHWEYSSAMMMASKRDLLMERHWDCSSAD